MLLVSGQKRESVQKACNMFFGIFLTASGQNILIPLKWIFNLDVNYLLSNGVDSSEDYLIFHANNFAKDANFLAPVERFFDSENEQGACYHGKIFKIFGNGFLSYIILMVNC